MYLFSRESTIYVGFYFSLVLSHRILEKIHVDIQILQRLIIRHTMDKIETIGLLKFLIFLGIWA